IQHCSSGIEEAIRLRLVEDEVSRQQDRQLGAVAHRSNVSSQLGNIARIVDCDDVRQPKVKSATQGGECSEVRAPPASGGTETLGGRRVSERHPGPDAGYGSAPLDPPVISPKRAPTKLWAASSVSRSRRSMVSVGRCQLTGTPCWRAITQ